MTNEEKKIILKIRYLVKIEEDFNEISDIISIAKSQNRKTTVINDNLHPIVLKRLVKTENIRWYKKLRNIFKISTVLVLN